MNIIDLYVQNNSVKNFEQILEKKNYEIFVSSAQKNHGFLLTYLTFLRSNNNVVYICENSYKASHAYETFCQLAGSDNVSFYFVDELASTELIAVSNEFRFERLNTLKNIIEEKPKIIVTFLQPLLRPLNALNNIKNSLINLKIGNEINVEMLTKKLIECGYKRSPTCELVGEFSVRGEVIDIYPLFYDNPLRIDLFDNEIEWIKIYNSSTQKSIDKVSEVIIYPISDFIYTIEQKEKAVNEISKIDSNNDELKSDIDDIENYNNPERITKYINYFYKETYNFLDYLKEPTVFFSDYNKIKDSYEQLMIDLNNIKKKTNLNLRYFDDFYSVHKCTKNVYLSEYKTMINGIKLTDIIELNGFGITSYSNNIKTFIEDIKNEYGTIIIACTDDKKYDLISNILKESNIQVNIINNIDKIKDNQINLLVIYNSLSYSFYNVRVISDNDILRNDIYKKTKYSSSKYNTISITNKEELKNGDYVVHIDYGIGIYLGLKTVELNSLKNDYLVIKYENMELYIPVEKINLIEKFQGTEGTIPKLSKIGTDDWKKKKEKIKAKVENIAIELINIQAIRLNKLGFKYPCDDELQKDFEEGFEYDVTKDQKTSIDEIKTDMEKGVIIDRLICGDVGYGKTEIAMRIAFKTVCSSKQVAYLAPTTILSRQHYMTFLDRFSKYGVKIAMLNRLVPIKEQNEILKALKNKEIDILIGTHRILSDDVKFSDLGLLIVDEEQRFGVLHKEKIKKLKTDINVLTLTATPIPRTLQMSIMGVRQFSLIQTPPKDRFPIQTYVLERNETVIKEAIYRELSRSGQVFYLHNRISSIQLVVKEIKRLVPEARICFAHGRMDKEELEDIIQSFIDKEYDVLVCTTIIETGIDIPNSNTLIIDEVDHLGLSQLYQIRGRIGRSDRIAYAYLTYKKGKVLTKSGEKRLNAIKEFTNLGSGYKIALRDLAIRGAGDILGSEQSGFIDMIGMDMYMKMLEDSVNKLKGTYKEKSEINYEVQVSKHINDNYVNDEEIKILIHEKINSVKSINDKKELIEELTDRFGKLNKDILIYIEERYLKSLLNKFYVNEVTEEDLFVKFSFPEQVSGKIDGKKMFLIANKISNNFYFEYKNKQLSIKLLKKPNDKLWIYQLCRLLEKL